MKRLTAVLLSLLLVISVGATAFAAFDTSRIDQYFETETQKRIDSMLELVLGKEKAEELVETSRTSSYDFTQVEAYVNQHVAQQSSEMFRLIEAAEQKARATYDNILRVVRDIPEVADPIRFLRAREIVHFQRFGEALSLVQQRLDFNNFYAFNPEFDKKCK